MFQIDRQLHKQLLWENHTIALHYIEFPKSHRRRVRRTSCRLSCNPALKLLWLPKVGQLQLELRHALRTPCFKANRLMWNGATLQYPPNLAFPRITGNVPTPLSLISCRDISHSSYTDILSGGRTHRTWELAKTASVRFLSVGLSNLSLIEGDPRSNQKTCLNKRCQAQNPHSVSLEISFQAQPMR